MIKLFKLLPLSIAISAISIGVVFSAQANPIIIPIKKQIDRPQPLKPEPIITTISGIDEINLVVHLNKIGAKFYGSYWCNHCKQQKSLFGAVAAAKLPYIECAKDGKKSQRQLCKEKRIALFPTWIINGKIFPGTYDLQKIAQMSDYLGSTNFRYSKDTLPLDKPTPPTN